MTASSVATSSCKLAARDRERPRDDPSLAVPWPLLTTVRATADDSSSDLASAGEARQADIGASLRPDVSRALAKELHRVETHTSDIPARPAMR